MLYPNDFQFNYNPKSKFSFYENKGNDGKWIKQENFPRKFPSHKTKEFFRVTDDKILTDNNQRTRKISLWERYCNNSSVHGFRYIADKNLHFTERIAWITLVSLAGLGVLYVSQLIQNRFTSSPLETVVASTIYPIYQIPFPAITICNYNRINWRRVQRITTDLVLPDVDNVTFSNLIEILKAFDNFEFGSFEDFLAIQNESLSNLEFLNISDLYRMVMVTCEELFIERCWWRNKYVSCCDIFVEQRSEYGICLGFNSELNEIGKLRERTEHDYPWRTSNYGDWSGLRVTIKIDSKIRFPSKKNQPGILVSVNHPKQWPNVAYFIPSNTSTSLAIDPTYSYTSQSVERLDVDARLCLFPDEAVKQNIMTLPDTSYFRANCLSECRQQYMIKYCNCTIDFLFLTGNYQICNVSGFQCLLKHDAIFNYEKPSETNEHFPKNETGMICQCLPECERIDYIMEISPIQSNDEIIDKIVLDVHFQQATMVKYRTDVQFEWLDLIVAFGGIAGLFLGCSILSLAELIFYLIVGIISFIRNRSSTIPSAKSIDISVIQLK